MSRAFWLLSVACFPFMIYLYSLSTIHQFGTSHIFAGVVSSAFLLFLIVGFVGMLFARKDYW